MIHQRSTAFEVYKLHKNEIQHHKIYLLHELSIVSTEHLDYQPSKNDPLCCIEIELFFFHCSYTSAQILNVQKQDCKNVQRKELQI